MVVEVKFTYIQINGLTTPFRAILRTFCMPSLGAGDREWREVSLLESLVVIILSIYNPRYMPSSHWLLRKEEGDIRYLSVLWLL